ncbi:hypothetical protein HS088_TW11G00795 [Tripterygium wilfordii]|uniref:Protein NRT1/ PTR FAMILY 4.5-like n=1 Tax=Tripterygium wilfordii TaxID=458696 RepID=A0A7J7D375_TRIWF|nr:hypothetical protein HS088_TW11G00795 [Tripterygium wilfordii]
MGIFRDDQTRSKRETKLGGNRAALFVYATEGLENMAFISNAVSLVTYFYGYMNFSLTNGIKAALPSLGADQFDEKDPKEAAKLSSFFNWFLFSLTIGAIIGVTFIVWISTNEGWEWSFGICTIALLFAIIFVCMGKSLYRNNVPNGSPLIRILQVFVAAIRNRKLPIPEKAEELHEIHDKEADLQSEILERTDQFRFLDRAAIVSNSAEVATSNNTGRWSLCTVTQVEEAKILIRMLPIILSTVFMNTCLAQLQTFSIQQSNTMDRHILGFEVPGASIPVIPLLFMFIMIPLYERVFIPFARKITGIPTGIRLLQRVGIGLVLSAISMAVAGIVETRRKHVAIEHNMVDSNEPLPISVFWLGFQYAIFGAADMFTLVGLLEFFYAESSAGMKSLSTAISWCSLAFGYFLSSVIVEVVNKVSGGWLASNNLNRDKLNYFYWLLALLSIANFGFYLVCASWYRYKKVGVKQVKDSGIYKDETESKRETKRGGNRAALFVYAALTPLGADQFDEKDPEEAVQLSSFFNWFMYSLTIGSIFGVTFVVWISINLGWDWSFGVSAVAILFSVIFLSMGKSLYRNNALNGSPIVRILQVFVAAIKNRSLPTPERTEELHEIHDNEAGQSEILERTDQFRFLDRAAIIRSSSTDVGTSKHTDRWSLCTVTQIEETKILVRMLPIIISTIFMNTCVAQLQTFSIQQSNTLDTNILGFKVPGPSIPVIPLLFMFVLIPVYEHIFVPLARKITGIPTGITHLQRIGVGLVLSAISMAVAGIVETRRKRVAIQHNMVDSVEPLPMSVLWLGFQYAIFGGADMFTLAGLLEFFHSESSARMKSFGTAISWWPIGFGYFLSSVLVEVVNKVSGGWLASKNLNTGKLNYFYWLLSGLSLLNFGFYLVCASRYRYKKVDVKQVELVEEDSSVLKGKMEWTKL